MKYIEIPQFPVLSGEKAIEALQTYMKELQADKSNELTKKQVKTMLKFTQALISAIEIETHPPHVPGKVARANRLVGHLHEISRRMLP